VSVVRLIVATGSSGPPASQSVIKEMPGSVASGAPYIISLFRAMRLLQFVLQNDNGKV